MRFMVAMMNLYWFVVAMMVKRLMMNLDGSVVFAVNYRKNFMMMMDFMVFMMQMRYRRRGRWWGMMKRMMEIMIK